MPSSNVSEKKQTSFYQRKDSRKYFVKNQLLTAKCETMDDMFSVPVQDVSPSGAFIYTKKNLELGQEIAMTIQLPNSDEFLRATGEIVRVDSGGFGVEFKIIFND
jgi:Tfp pilus assembly protein PilZ